MRSKTFSIQKPDSGLRDSQKSLRFAENKKIKTPKDMLKRNINLDLIFISVAKFIRSSFANMPLFIKLSICACIIVCIAAAIFIPQVMLPEKTNIALNDNGLKVAIAASEKTVGELLQNTGIVLSENDYIDRELSDPIEQDMEITIYRAMQVSIESGKEKIVVPIFSGTVADALSEAKIEVGPDDEVYPALDEIITPGTTITHILVEKEQKTETQKIGYKEVTKNNSSLEQGKQKVTEGSEGLREITVEVTYKNGIEVKQEKLDSKVVKEPVNKVTEIGTKPKPTPKPSSGSKATSKPKLTADPGSGKLTRVPKTSEIYSSSIEAHKAAPKPDESIIQEVRVARHVTAYDNEKRTAAGTYPRIGTISCYWKILPKGTKIYIPGYGYGIVEDQGGNKNVDNLDLDLFFGHGSEAEAAAEKWGRKRNIEFYILK